MIDQQNLIDNLLDRYQSEDFMGPYVEFLAEDKVAAERRIMDILSDQYSVEISFENAEKILNWFIEENEYRDFSNYYVGRYCIDSIAFGEIEETITAEIENLDIDLWEDANFYISDDKYAYFDLSDSGVYFDLRDFLPMFSGENARFCIEKLKGFLG